ncbi:MAG TPA: hypothetical protein VFZ48_03410 [Candidatus Saccharimonadales bacterium]
MPTEVTLSPFALVRPSEVAWSTLSPLAVGDTISLGDTNLAHRVVEAMTSNQQIRINHVDAGGVPVTVNFVIDKVYPGEGVLNLKVRLLDSSTIKLRDPGKTQAIISVDMTSQTTTLFCEEVGIAKIELLSPGLCISGRDEPYMQTAYVLFRGAIQYWTVAAGTFVEGQTIPVRLASNGKVYPA